MPPLNHNFVSAGELAVTSMFVNRESESELLASALLEHVARCESSQDGQSFENVLTFHGISGIGKTYLSRRLAFWLDSKLPATDHWGAPPEIRNVATVRWELDNSLGNLDTIPLMLSIRKALHRVKKSWPAFDLAFAAYFSSVRPGDELSMRGLTTVEFADEFSSTLSEIAQDLGSTALVGGVTGTSRWIQSAQDIVERARARADDE